MLYTGGFTDQARLRASGHPVADTLTEAVTLAATLRDRGRSGAQVGQHGQDAAVLLGVRAAGRAW